MRVSQHWYQGTADAVYQNIYSIGSEQSNYVFILSGDHIYKMNYQKMLEQHVAAGADVTVATIEMDPAEAAGKFGILETDEDWRIIGFEEKPANPKPSRVHPGKVNASMGVYLFNTQLLVPILIADAEDPSSSHDFGKDILPRIIDKYRVFAYNFRRRKQEGNFLLARRRHHRRLSRSEHGSRLRFADLQFLRQELAAAHLAAAISAGEIRFCRSGAHGRGARFHRRRRVDRFRRPR